MRHVGRQVDADPRLDDELFGDGLHRPEVALATVDISIELALKRGRFVLEGGDVDVLYTLDLEQEAVLDVEVHGRRRGRGGDEQIPGPPRHSALPVGDELVHLVQAFVDQLGVLGSLVDVTSEILTPFRSTSLIVCDGGPSPTST